MKKALIFLIIVTLLGGVGRLVYAGSQRVLRVCQASVEPVTLDPHMHHNIETEDITRQICEHLIERDPDGKLIPALATSWQLTNERSWQIKLRKGVKFHNGEEFGAEVVKFSIERIINPEQKSPQRHWFGSISHVEIVDDHTINIITKGVDVLLPSKLSSFLGNIVPMQYLRTVGDSEFSMHPIGTGPFKFLSRESGKQIALIPNENYWGKVPQIEKLLFYFIPDPEVQAKMLLNGDLDIVSNVLPKYSLLLKKNPQTNIVKKPTTQYITLRLNTMKEGPLKDVKVRRALSYAIDTSKLIKYLYNGNGIPLATITMPEEVGFNPRLKPYPFDLAKAQQLLAEAGVPRSGFSFTLLTFEDLESLGIAVKQQLAKIGVDTKIKSISRGEYINLVTKQSIDFDGVIGNPTDPFFDASFQLDLMFNSKSAFARHYNKSVDGLLLEASQTIDENKRKVVLEKIQDLIYEDTPNLFSFQSVRIYGLRQGISKFLPYTDGLLRLNDITMR